MGLRSFIALLAQNCVRCIALTKRVLQARGVHSKVENFGADFTRSPSIWADGTEAHKNRVDVHRVQISIVRQV